MQTLVFLFYNKYISKDKASGNMNIQYHMHNKGGIRDIFNLSPTFQCDDAVEIFRILQK